MLRWGIALALAVAGSAGTEAADPPGGEATGPRGYYRFPALGEGVVVFCAEGDLWKVAVGDGGGNGLAVASRLTSHPGEEQSPVISPDGVTIAFAASYEGPQDVFTMPLSGGLPTRQTFAGRTRPVAFRDAGVLVVATQVYSTLPNTQLMLVDMKDAGASRLLPLAQASEGVFGSGGTGGALFFTRLDFQGSHTRRYAGGTAQNLWRVELAEDGSAKAEAAPLTGDYDGTSASPMWSSADARVYFRSDRDGVMNIWSMSADGKDLKQHTHHTDYEVKSPSMWKGRIAYQLGADLWVLETATGETRKLDITLNTDLDQTREKWINKPAEWITSAHLSADGERVAITARGQVFVAPRKFGRLAEVTRRADVRHRDARFMPDGKAVLSLSDESGEVELWTLPAMGDGSVAPSQLSTDGQVLRWEAAPSPDGRLIAHHDKNQRLWVMDVGTKASTKIDESTIDVFADLKWSADSRYLAYTAWTLNLSTQVKLYDHQTGKVIELTSDRTASSSPVWDSKGEFLYFLSERNLQSVVASPWGFSAPEPFFDKKVKVYALALRPGIRSPFDEPDELQPKTEKKKDEKKEEPKQESKPAPAQEPGDSATPTGQPAEEAPTPTEGGSKPEDGGKKQDDQKPKAVELDPEGISGRVYMVPIPPGNYAGLSMNEKGMFFTDTASDAEHKVALKAFAIDEAALKKREWKVETVAEDIQAYEMSADGKSLLIRKASSLHIVDAAAASADLGKNTVNLGGWQFAIVPRDEWRQMYAEAWRLHRDYFYDTDMHGVDWKAVRTKYAPLVDRVASRGDLSDILAQMIAELSALHHFVVGGDVRTGQEDVGLATLGAVLSRVQGPGAGFRIDKVYEADPDNPEIRSPLARPGLDIRVGDVITRVNGVDAGTLAGMAPALRNQAGKQVLLGLRRPDEANREFQVVVKPMSIGAERELRYQQWELDRRRMVEELGKGDIGYVHLKAMGAGDIADFTRNFYPVFNRKGLVIDVRHNGGGNIDSWVLARLMRRPWFYWQGRIGEPTWNMQYAFRGHMVVLCNERTGSDGEAFSEGFRRLGLGKVMGTRTWGGEIWLSFSNYLVDKGIASAAEIGVYGPEGTWLIEGRGVEPDITVDNLPVATFRGEDAQLKAAIEHLQQLIKEKPVETPPAPKKPNKSFVPKAPAPAKP